MSPILLRPVREQLEHDRVIRLLYARARRRYHAAMNPGGELNAPVGSGDNPIYPDLVLASLARGRRLKVVVEVETGESVNNLEALAEWARMARLRAAFHLYVPAGSVETARRICADHGIVIQEIWSYHPIGDQMRFTLAYRGPVVKKSAARQPAGKPSRAGRRASRPKPMKRRKPAPKARAAMKKRVRAKGRPRTTPRKAARGTRRARTRK